MTNREINRRVKSIIKNLLAIGFQRESHNANSFVKKLDQFDVYVTLSLTGWTIKVVDLADKNDNRNVINGTLSFNNERDSSEFFTALFEKIMWQASVKRYNNCRAHFSAAVEKLKESI